MNTLEEVSPSDRSQWHTEKFYRSEVERLFRVCKETEAYSRLQPLQGHCIPTFHGKTEFKETSLTATELDTSVRGILHEYINDISLEDVEVDSSVAHGNPHTSQRIFDIFRKVTEMGILQNDVRPANVMVRNDGNCGMGRFRYHRDITPPAPVSDLSHIYGGLWEYNKQVTKGREE